MMTLFLMTYLVGVYREAVGRERGNELASAQMAFKAKDCMTNVPCPPDPEPQYNKLKTTMKKQ